MDTQKKLLLGLSLLFAIVSVFLFSHKVLALAQDDLDKAKYKLISSTEIDATIGGKTVKFFALPIGGGNPNNYKPASNDFCDTTIFNDSNAKDPLNIHGITLDTNFNDLVKNGGDTINAVVDLDYKDANGQCQNYQNSLTFTKQADGTLAATESPPPAAPAGTAKSCESNTSGSSLAWILCPALSIADSAAGAFNRFVDDQLCINTGPSSTSGGVVCGGKSILGDQTHQGVKRAWSTFRILATSLLVIIMLVMVISQAIGSGPFDAYAVRKMLPKLVIAAIAIQLSWFILKWTIDISNDVGRGIGDLLFQPFGGSANMKLDTLVGNGVSTGGTGTADTFTFFAILAAGVGTLVLSIPGLLLMALYVVLALLTAFIVLILRKLLILMLVLLAPIALILWILPGTQKYWKLWSDNFNKMLLMFPMIVALIAAGRIFAYITAGSPSPSGLMFSPHLAVAHLGPLPIPYVGSVTTFIDLAIIIAAYFGPYFLIPQTYRWGGAAMGAIGKGVKSGVEKGAKPAKDYLDWRKGLSPWKQAREARKAEVARRSKVGFAEGLASGGLRGRYRRARLAGVGRPGAERELRGRIVQSAEAEVEKQRKEDEQRALVQLMQRDLPQFHRDSQDDVREAIATGKTMRVMRRDGTPVDFDGAQYGREHIHGQRAALDRALIHGQMGVVDQYYTEAMESGDDHRIEEATRFKDDNAEVLGRRLTHVLKGYGVAVRSTSGEIAQQSGHEVESMLARYSSDVAARTAAGDAAGAAAAQAELDGYIQRHYEARANPALSGSVDLRGTAAVEAYTEVRTSPNPADPRTVAAHEVIDEINTGARAIAAGRSDREANRSRYQTPGLPADRTIPPVTV